MRHHLDGLTEIVATALLVDYRLVDAACGHGIGLGGLDVRETLVVTKVEIGLHAIDGDVTLSMLIRIERAGVDVDIRIKFLDSDVVAPCLKELSYRR